MNVFRPVAVVFAVVVSVLTFVPSVVHAGVGARATPNIPLSLTVGDTNVPASIVIGNDNDDGEAGNTNTVCNWDDAAPCTASVPGSLPGDPGINAILSCGLLGADAVCEPAGADPGVFSFSATGTGAAGTDCTGVIFDIVQTDATYGTLRFTPQAPPTNVAVGPGATCRIDFTVNVVKMPTIDQAPGFPGVQTVFIADNTQWTVGGAGPLNNSARGTDNATISKKVTTITTTASGELALGAGTLTDVADVFGQSSPDGTATVSFRLYGPNDATCVGTPVFEDLDRAYPTTGGALTSAPYTPTTIGTHRWVATYSGDANNASVAGTCGDAAETTLVTKANPTIATTASSDTTIGAGTLTDIATVSGRSNPVDGATVDFRLYAPADTTCSGTPVHESLGVAYPVSGGAVTSTAYTPTAPGTYRWVASYSGDVNNNAVTGACGDSTEQTVVSRATPTIVTTASPSVAIGDQLTDSATVTGQVGPVGSTIDFRLFGPNDATCSNEPVFTSLGVDYPLAGGPVVSAPFTATLPGVYRWVATYNGNANNSPVAGSCGEASETATVFSATPIINTQASAAVRVGDGNSMTDVATVTGRVAPVAGATVDFRLYGPNDNNCSGTPAFESLGVPYPVAGGPVSSAPFTPTVAGTYRWIASYSGDANNAPDTGACGEPTETAVVNSAPEPAAILPATGPAETRIMLLIAMTSLLLGMALLGSSSRRRRLD